MDAERLTFEVRHIARRNPHISEDTAREIDRLLDRLGLNTYDRCEYGSLIAATEPGGPWQNLEGARLPLPQRARAMLRGYLRSKAENSMP